MSLTSYLCVRDADAAIDFYRRAFGAVETLRIEAPPGTIGHAELTIGDARLMLSDEYPDGGIYGPEHIGGTPVTLCLEVDDADAAIARAVEAGAEVIRPIADQFYGRRSGQLVDPFGHRWDVSSLLEELSNEEIQRRARDLFGG